MLLLISRATSKYKRLFTTTHVTSIRGVTSYECLKAELRDAFVKGGKTEEQGEVIVDAIDTAIVESLEREAKLIDLLGGDEYSSTIKNFQESVIREEIKNLKKFIEAQMQNLSNEQGKLQEQIREVSLTNKEELSSLQSSIQLDLDLERKRRHDLIFSPLLEDLKRTESYVNRGSNDILETLSSSNQQLKRAVVVISSTLVVIILFFRIGKAYINY